MDDSIALWNLNEKENQSVILKKKEINIVYIHV